MLNLFRDVRELIAQANQIAASGPQDGPRWSWYLTNRSFLVMLIAVALNIGAMFGLPLPGWLSPLLADQIVELVTAALVLWAFVERLLGRTRVIWTRRQGRQAVAEAIALNATPEAEYRADALTEALRDAGA